MSGGPSRRLLLATIGAVSVPMAGCFESDEEESTETPDGTSDEPEGGSDDDDDGNDGDGGDETESLWPAITEGELLSEFEEIDRWEAITGAVEAVPEEARAGSQAALLESEEDIAAMAIRFPEPLDFRGWDTSVAVKPTSATRLEVEFLAPGYGERLTSVRTFPEGYDDWLRVDCGYEHKPADEPDLSEVTGLNVVAVGSDDGTEVVLDDLRRTEGLETGAAILVHYGGLDSHWEVAADRLAEREWPAAVAVDPTRIGDGGRMSEDRLRDLDERGWDVCSLPGGEGDLVGRSEEHQRGVIESARDELIDRGFPEGARHFFAPEWRRIDPTTVSVLREAHETGFVFGGSPTGAPPTGAHTVPTMWGPALHDGVRRHVNLADQYGQLTVLHIPEITGDDGGMSVEDYEHLLDHIDQRGLEVVTPSDLIDGTLATGGDTDDEARERPERTVFEAGASHSLDGSGSETTSEVDLDEGLLVARFDHDGEEFAAEVDGDEGRTPLVQAPGDGTGESIAVVGGGSYRLVVEADGDWTIDLDQPGVHADDLSDLPVSDSDAGSSFVGPLWTEGNVRVAATHDGEGRFVVDGYGADGRREQLINQEGEFDGSRSYSAGGVVWIDLEADGDWTIEVDST